MSIIKDKKICGESVHAEIYNSVDPLIRDCKKRDVRISEYDMEKSLDKDFYGVDNFDEALDLLKNGYTPVVDKLKRTLKGNAPKGVKWAMTNEVNGFMPIVPLALKGLPNSMLDIKRNCPTNKVIDLYYDITCNCSTRINQFLRAGEILLSSIIGLEKKGYRFNLYAVQSYCGTYKKEETVDFLCIKVKPSDRPLDIRRMSFTLIHPSFFRVIGFDWQGKSPVTRDIGCGRGRGLYYDHGRETRKKMVSEIFGNNAYYASCSELIGLDYDKDYLKEVLEDAVEE